MLHLQFIVNQSLSLSSYTHHKQQNVAINKHISPQKTTDMYIFFSNQKNKQKCKQPQKFNFIWKKNKEIQLRMFKISIFARGYLATKFQHFRLTFPPPTKVPDTYNRLGHFHCYKNLLFISYKRESTNVAMREM